MPENRAARRAAERLGAALGRAGMVKLPFHPLVLHGPSGVGKTAVIAGLVRTVISGTVVRTVQVVPANDLDLPTSNSAEPPVDFADLASVDLLVIEDFQHLPPRSVESVCQLLDGREQRRRPTIVTAPTGPAQMTTLPRRLTSRLAAGLVVGIEPLSTESRAAILAVHANRRGVKFTDEALMALAALPTGGGMRPLLGALETLKTLTKGRRTPLTRETVEELLPPPDPPGVPQIVAKAAAAFGVKAKDLLGPSRLPAVLLPRQVAMFLARTVAKLSLATIGEKIGGRDHTTVRHAVLKIEKAMASDPAFAGRVQRLTAELC